MTLVFHLKIELDRNMPQVRLSALLSSAFADVADLDSLVATITDRTIAGAGLKRDPATAIRAWAVWDLTGRCWLAERIW